jgi:tetratricopeptide (TPR) repeat protein/flagellar basal body-associated protein FliL
VNTLRIFISSPGDVAEEREKAKQVIATLQRHYDDQVRLIPVLWEDLAIPATASFQQGIDFVLSERHRIDIAVFILWSRLGSPLGAAIVKQDGSPYLSGTEREFDLMLAAFEQSGGKIPIFLAYTRDDDEGFTNRLDARKHGDEALEELVKQRKLVKQFIRERFQDKEGRNLRAYHSYREPVSFAQRLHVHLRGAVDDLLALDTTTATWTEAPYRSLEVFDIRHAPIFCGRDEEICDLLQRLRDQERAGCAFVCIVGASGSGKSSLARAGVAATLLQRSFDDGVKEWRAAVFLPSLASGDLFLALARILAEPLPELREGIGGIERFAKALEDGNREAAGILFETAFKAACAKLGGSLRLLLVLDQMEELWTDRSITDERRGKFLQATEAFARSGSLSVLATLRSDFYPQAQLSEAFLRMKGERGHFDLTPPGTSALQKLIVQPAHRSALRFERDERTGRTLDQRILEDAARDPSALPLLQYALAELHERRDEKQRLLTFAAYEDMGGVEGALGQRAAQTFDSLPSEAQAALDELLPLLVSVDIAGEQNAVRRRAPLAELTNTPTHRHLTQALIAARFVTTDEQRGTPIATLAHEALLRRWERITTWININRDHLRTRARIEQDQARWENSHATTGRRDPSLLLPPGLPSEEGRALLNTPLLQAATRSYIRASIEFIDATEASARRNRRNVVLTLSILLLLAVAGAVWALLNKRQEAEARKTADQQTEVAKQSAARADESLYFASIAASQEALQRNDSVEALRLLAKAPREHRGWEWDFLVRRADFAPIQLRRSQIALLDCGPLKGSGLREIAEQMFDGAISNLEAEAGGVIVKLSSSGRGGDTLNVTTAEDEIDIINYKTQSYGSVFNLWLSPDASCMMIITDPLRIPAMHGDEIVRPPSAEASSESHDEAAIYVLPVPPTFSTKPLSKRVVPPANENEPADADPVDALRAEDMKFNAYGERMMILDAGGESFITAQRDSGAIGKFRCYLKRHEASNGKEMEFNAALLALPEREREAALKWYGSADDRSFLACDWSDPRLSVLTVRWDIQKGELTPLVAPAESRTFDLPGTGHMSSTVLNTGNGALDSGGVFSPDGKAFLICPAVEESAGIFDRSTLKLRRTLHGKLNDGESNVGLNSYGGRGNHPIWGISPLGSYAWLVSYNGAGASWATGICRTDTGQAAEWQSNDNVSTVGWDLSEKIFATYSSLTDLITLRAGNSGPVLAKIYARDMQGAKLIQEGSCAADRILVGRTLMRARDRRRILAMPDNIAFAPDWSWVGFTEKDQSYYGSDWPCLRIVERIGMPLDEGQTFAEKLKGLQMALLVEQDDGQGSGGVSSKLTTLGVLHREIHTTVTASYSYRLAQLMGELAWPELKFLELSASDVEKLRARAVTLSPRVNSLAVENPEPDDMRFALAACSVFSGGTDDAMRRVEKEFLRAKEGGSEQLAERWSDIAGLLAINGEKPSAEISPDWDWFVTLLSVIRDGEAKEGSEQPKEANAVYPAVLAGTEWLAGRKAAAWGYLAQIEIEENEKSEWLRGAIKLRKAPVNPAWWFTVLPAKVREGFESAVRAMPGGLDPGSAILAMAREEIAAGQERSRVNDPLVRAIGSELIPMEMRLAAANLLASISLGRDKPDAHAFASMVQSEKISATQRLIVLGRLRSGRQLSDDDESEKKMLRDAIEAAGAASQSADALLGIIGVRFALDDDMAAERAFAELLEAEPALANEAAIESRAWTTDEWLLLRSLLGNWLEKQPVRLTPAAAAMRAARIALLKDDEASAVRAFQKALALGAVPSGPEWSGILPSVLRTSEKKVREKLAEQALAAHPNDAATHATAAVARMLGGHKERALQALREAGRLDRRFRTSGGWKKWRQACALEAPVLSEAIDGLLALRPMDMIESADELVSIGHGLLLRYDGNQGKGLSIAEASLKYAEEAIRRDPTLHEALDLRLKALRARAKALFSIGRHEDALRAYRTVIEAGGRDVDDFTAPAYLAGGTGNKSESEYFLTLGLRMHPKSEEIAHSEGWTRINLQENPAALAAFLRARSLLERNEKPSSTLLGGLALAQWLNNEREAAIGTYRQLVETGRSQEEPKDWADPKTIAAKKWPAFKADSMEALRAATLARHPDLMSEEKNERGK